MGVVGSAVLWGVGGADRFPGGGGCELRVLPVLRFCDS